MDPVIAISVTCEIIATVAIATPNAISVTKAISSYLKSDHATKIGDTSKSAEEEIAEQGEKT